jgi:ubiquinone/menaquinone biosynthesis C-methylase UbiE
LFDAHHNPKEGMSLLNPTKWAANEELADAVDLLDSGYSAITVLDLSGTALATARKRLGVCSTAVRWMEADITKALLPVQAYDVWHDRTVFYFLTSLEERRTCAEVVLRAVKPGGHVIVAAFAEDGPTRCSGLPAMR